MGRGESPRRGLALVRESDLARELAQLGVQLVHSSLSRLGYVMHGAEAVVRTLEALVGEQGTLLVPTFTGAHTDPASRTDPPLPEEVWEEVRASMPLFDPERSLPEHMGAVATRVLLDPRSQRSSHPLCSFADLGPHAEELLLGVDQCANSALLHAQALADVPSVRRAKGRFLAQLDGERTWVTPERLPECGAGFDRVEDDLVARGLVRVARVGDGTCRLMKLHPLVAHMEHYLRLRPDATCCGREHCRQCA